MSNVFVFLTVTVTKCPCSALSTMKARVHFIVITQALLVIGNREARSFQTSFEELVKHASFKSVGRQFHAQSVATENALY